MNNNNFSNNNNNMNNNFNNNNMNNNNFNNNNMNNNFNNNNMNSNNFNNNNMNDNFNNNNINNNNNNMSAASLADAAVYAGLDPYIAVGEVEPIVKLLCRPDPQQDVMGELLALEASGTDLSERTSVSGDRPIHLLLEFAQHHPPKVALAALKLFLAFSDANDPRTDGATSLHICLVINPENAWFLAQPLVAAGADMNVQWARPPPNWIEVIDDRTSRSYWYNEATGESSWEMPEGVEATIPSAVAAKLAADPPLGLRDVSTGGDEGYGGPNVNNQLGFPEGIAVDSLLDDMLGAICAPQSWVPDNMFDACMSCDKNFGFLTRRHHCRHCGRLVCKQCQREMQGMTVWASSDPDAAGTDQAGRYSIAPGDGGGGGSSNGVRRSSVGNRYGDDSIADTIKVCRQCAACHYRANLRLNNAAPRRGGY
jgi:hypothetical protein